MMKRFVSFLLPAAMLLLLSGSYAFAEQVPLRIKTAYVCAF